MRLILAVRSLIAIFNRRVAVMVLSLLILFFDFAQAQSMFFHLLGANSLPPFTWTGNGGDANWTSPGNWSSNVVPGVGDTAHFMGANACIANCSPTINASISILGMDIQSTYAGTITQAATNTITVGSGGWLQTASTFIGGDANITINNIFTLSGGVFTATSAQMLVSSGFNYTAGTFNHNNGLLRFDNNGIVAANSTININLPGAVSLWNLQYSGGYAASSATYTVNLASGSFNVLGQFQIGLTTGGATGAILASGGSINLKGNLIVDPSIAKVLNLSPTNLILDGTGAQTYTATGGSVPYLVINKASGAVTPSGGGMSLVAKGFSLSAGSFTAPASVFTILGDFNITGGTTYTDNNGSINFERYGGAVADFTITLPVALTVTNLSFGGGVAGAADITNWAIAGATPTFNVLGNLDIGNTQGGTGVVNVNGGTIYVTGNYNANTYSGAGTTALTFTGAVAQSFTKTGAGTTLGGAITIDKSAGTMSLATLASFNTAGQDLSVTTGTMDMAGYNLTVNDVLTVGSAGKLICNGGALSAASYVIDGEISCGPGAGITWTGLAGNNLWNTAGNWTNNTVPGASDIAIFNSNCVGANCNATMNVAVSVKGIKINSSYTGTITQQAGMGVTIGTSGWMQEGGSFAGGDSTITMNGIFTLSAGSYASTSGTLVANANYTISGTPVFLHNGGTLLFSVVATVTPGSVSYNNVTFSGNNRIITIIGSMTVNGTLTLADTSGSYGAVNSGTILASGNVVLSTNGKGGSALIKIVGSGNQTITGVSAAGIPPFEIASTGGTVSFVGTFLFRYNYTYTSGTVNTGTSTFIFTLGQTITPGPVAYNNVTFAGSNNTMTLIGNMTVNGTLTLADTSGSYGAVNSGTVLAYGDVVFTSNGKGGSSLIKIVGSGNQTITGVSTASIPPFEIASTGGTVAFAGILFFRYNYTYTSGTINAGTSTLLFTTTQSIIPGAATYNNVTFAGSNQTQNLAGGTISVNGILSLADTSPSGGSVNSGTIQTYGDITFSSYGKKGTALLNVLGTSSANLKIGSSSNVPTGDVTVNKSGSANLYLTNNAAFNSAGQNMTVSGGTVNMSGNNLTINSTLTVGVSGTVLCNGGTLSQGSLVNSGVVDCASSPINWTGAGGNANWDTAGNWSGGVVPGVNDLATFTNAICGVNCNVTVNINPNVKGIRMDADYTGTITQSSGVAMTIGSQGWFQLSGTFLGANSLVSLNGNTTINGGSYRATSGTTSTDYNFVINNTPTFDANNGTFIFSGGPSGGSISPASIQFYNVNFAGTNGAFWLNNSTVTVNGTLTIGDSVSSTGGINNGTIRANGDVVFNQQGYIGNANLIFDSSANTTLTVGVSAAVLGSGSITINKNGELKALSAISLTTSGQNLSLTSGIFNLNGNILTVNSLLSLSTTSSLICGSGGSYTSGTLSNSGSIICGGYGFNWTGAGGNANWNTAANWSGGVVPGASDVAYFSNLYCGGTCNATINVNPSIKGVILASDYTGTITQSSGIALTIGAAGWTQAGGTFVGSNSTNTMNGLLAISGGAYTATSGSTTINTDYSISGSATFTHNSGTILFASTSTIVPGAVSYNNVTFAGTQKSQSLSAGTMSVYGTLTLADTSACCAGGINTGVILAYGNVVSSSYGKAGSAVIKLVGSGNQTLSGVAASYLPNIEIASTGGTVTFSGSLKINGNYTYTSGAVNTGTSTLLFYNSSTIIPGGVAYNNVTFAGTQESHSLSGGTMSVYGTLSLADTSVCCVGSINTGTILAYGNVVSSSYGKVGSAVIKLVGSGNQTLSGVSTSNLPHIEISSTGGTVTLSGTLIINGNYTYTSGTVNSGTSTIKFVNSSTIIPGAVAYNNVTFTGSQTTYNLSSGTMSVNGLLTIADTHINSGGINSGTILANSNVTFSSYGKHGSALIKIAGSTDQTITGVSAARVSNLEIASAGGTVTLAGTIYIYGNYTYTSGTLNAGTSTLLFGNPSTIIPGGVAYNNVSFVGSQVTQSLSGGTMNVYGLLTIGDTHVNSGFINSGTLQAYGNVTYTSYGKKGNAALTLAGTTNNTLQVGGSAQRPTGAVTINKTGGTSVTMTSSASFNNAAQDLTITAGTLDMAGYNLTIGSNISNSGTLQRGLNPGCGILSYGGTYSGTAAICP